MYFKNKGIENTEETLKIAVEAAKGRGIRHLVVASTFGDTARKALEVLKGTDIQLVIVTHNTGFGEPGRQEFQEEIRKEVEGPGGKVVTATMPFRGIGRALKSSVGCSQEEIVANTLRMLCQGMKVCVEITLMAADAGAIPCTDIIAVSGTGRGADTAVVICARPSNNLFDIKIREILAKPLDW